MDMDVGRPVEECVWKTQIFSIHTDYIVTLNVETVRYSETSKQIT